MIKVRAFSNVFLTAGLVLFLLIAGRGYMALGDFSYFFVAGSDFVNPAETPAPVWIQDGQGYDGQFFYRYSLDPFDFSKTNYGVTVDFVTYRIQRIMYPLLVWFFSFGGIPQLVPFMMVLVNAMAFLGIIYFALKLSEVLALKNTLAFTPLLLCGIYMSLARSLSEVTELCFFMGAIYFLCKKDYFKYILFGSFTVLTRETSLVALMPLSLITIFNLSKAAHFRVIYLGLFIPFLVFAALKGIIFLNAETQAIVPGSGNFAWPILGIINGFRENLDISSNKKIMQMMFYVGYFIWQIFLLLLVLKAIKAQLSKGFSDFEKSLTVTYLSWMIFAIFFSAAIYGDDWSFVRVFGLWNMVGFVIICSFNQKLPRFFMNYSVVLVMLTVMRLIIRQ